MKKIYNYTFQLVFIYVLLLSLFSVSNIELTVDNYNSSILNVNNEKTLDSTLFAINDHIDSNEAESINKVEDNSTEIKKDEIVDNSNNEIQSTIQTTEEKIDTSSYAVISTERVTISHYGHDCYGCTSGYTAGGYYVGDGRIYYNDETFGNVRVVAADKKYPIGTIIRLEYHDTSIIAIVLDRGGGIGDGKRFQIDLLEPSEKEANSRQIASNSKLEVLRLGY